MLQKSQTKKDTERQVAAAEAMGQEDTLTDEDLSQADEVVALPADEWCCMYRVLSLQEDFANEKSLIQHYLEGCRTCLHVPAQVPLQTEPDRVALGVCQVL